jgi:MinD-like ATPase involved in chromosome partitioning or flagellar assembly
MELATTEDDEDGRATVRATPDTKVRLVAVHSFRGGTGKSNLAANLAFLAARAGARVAVIDTDLQSPGVHVVFGVKPEQVLLSLSDFVQERCEINEVAIDLTHALGIEGEGKLFFLPSSLELEAISKILVNFISGRKRI